MKAWYESKVVWAMVVQSIISALLIAQEWYSKGDFSIPACIGLAVGILVIVLRIWFTDTVINTPKAQRKAEELWAAEDGREGWA